MTATAEAVRERPILFSAEMVLAILEGEKTQTRRVMKTQPTGEPRSSEDWARGLANGGTRFDRVITEADIQSKAERLRGRVFPFTQAGRDSLVSYPCPYGYAGDRLWVREAFFDHGTMGGLATKLEERVEYRATEWDRKGDAGGGWKPSIHMPRWASRITLEITEVRVERLQDITREDAIAEGCTGWGAQDFTTMEWDGEYPEQEYQQLWDSLNKARGCGWDVNPWVWVIGFRRLLGERGEDFPTKGTK